MEGKRGYLIYRREEAIKNEAFIRFFEEEGKKAGLFFSLVRYEEYKKSRCRMLC